MEEENHTAQDAEKPEGGQSDSDFGDFRGVFVAGAWGFLSLLLAAAFWPNMTERLKFFMGTLWVLVTAFAVIAQVRINRSQWQAMLGSLKQTDKVVENMKGQLEAMNAQKELLEREMKETEKREIYFQRAYVTAKIKDIGLRDSSLQFRLRIENSGNTPANDVAVFYGCGLREKPPCRKIDGVLVFDEAWPYVTRFGVVAPNKSYHVLTTPETSFTKPEFQRFESGQIAYYCWGKIVYEDIFNEPRTTWFCFFQSQTELKGFPCEYGNEAI